MSRRSLSRENAGGVRVLSARHPAVPLPGAGGATWDPGGAQRDLLPLRGARARQGNAATATVLDCQAHAATFACHGVRCLSIAFRMINSFRMRSEEHTSELQSLAYLVCRLLLEKKNNRTTSAVGGADMLLR